MKETSEENYEDELLEERESWHYECEHIPSLLNEGIWESGGLVPLILNPYTG